MANEIAMTGEILPAEAIAGLSTTDLRRTLGEAIGATVATIRRTATIWAELERRGEDMSEFRFTLASYMRPIAAGMLLPEVVAMLAGQRRMLDAVASLPVHEQQRLIAGGEIDIVAGSGDIQKKSLPNMSWPEVARVIRGGVILTSDEQKLALRRVKALTATRPKRGRQPRIVVFPDTGEVRIGEHTLALDKLLAALRAAGVR